MTSLPVGQLLELPAGEDEHGAAAEVAVDVGLGVVEELHDALGQVVPQLQQDVVRAVDGVLDEGARLLVGREAHEPPGQPGRQPVLVDAVPLRAVPLEQRPVVGQFPGEDLRQRGPAAAAEHPGIMGEQRHEDAEDERGEEQDGAAVGRRRGHQCEGQMRVGPTRASVCNEMREFSE